MEHFGLHPAPLFAVGVIVFELSMSALILAGIYRWAAAIALAAFTFAATSIAFRFWELPPGMERSMAMNGFFAFPVRHGAANRYLVDRAHFRRRYWNGADGPVRSDCHPSSTGRETPRLLIVVAVAADRPWCRTRAYGRLWPQAYARAGARCVRGSNLIMALRRHPVVPATSSAVTFDRWRFETWRN
jgi:hypothetical protein